MNCYRILLLGENFLIRKWFKMKMMGFYATRFVKALDEEQAELEAVKMIKDDHRLIKMTKNKSGQTMPKIYLDEIERIEDSQMQKSSGYTWFEMDTTE